MIDQAQLILAVSAGMLAGFCFLLIGRRLRAGAPHEKPVADAVSLPLAQPYRSLAEAELTPEVQTFIAALTARDAPKPRTEDPIWAVDIWDTREHRSEAQGLPH